MAIVLVAGAFLTLGAAMVPQQSQAGTFVVRSCNDHASKINNMWGAFSISGAGAQTAVACAATNNRQGIVVRVNDNATLTSYGNGAQAHIDAASGSYIVSLSFDGWSYRQTGSGAVNQNLTSYNSSGSLSAVLWGVGSGTGTSGMGDGLGGGRNSFSNAAGTLPGQTTRIKFQSTCTQSPGSCNNNTANGLPRVEGYMYGTTVTVDDYTNPNPISGVSGTLVGGGWLRGTGHNVNFDASDNTGIEETRFYLNGALITTTNSSCDYSKMSPCPNISNRNYTVNTTTLANGTANDFRLRAYDAGARVVYWPTSANRFFNVDNLAPAAPGSTADGGATDIDWQSATTSLTADWTAGSDTLSGINGYRVCFSTGTSCGGTIVWQGDTTGTGTVYTRTGLTLTSGTKYYACVRTRDNAINSAGVTGNLSGWRCSDGVTVDGANPIAPSAANDGSAAPDIDWQNSTTTLRANWTAGSDALSGVKDYNFCFSTAISCGGTVVSSGYTTGLTRTSSGLTLANGVEYWICVRTRDNALRLSGWRCSDGVVVDTGLPGLPAAARDGSTAGLDIDWQNSTTSLSGNWDVGSDAVSGVQDYNYCFSTLTACGGTVVSTGYTTATSRTSGSLALTNGQKYFTCVKTRDRAGNVSSAWRCSNGVTVDNGRPVEPGQTFDGTSPGVDATWTNSTTSISANWTAGSDPLSGVGDYRFCFSTAVNCTGTTVASGYAAATSVTTPATLVNGTLYYACIKTRDRALNESLAWTCSNGITVDATAPAAPALVNDGTGADIDAQASTTQLSANWPAGSDAASGVWRYNYCFSTLTSCGGTQVSSGFTTALSRTTTGLSLTNGATYFSCVRTQDNAGNYSAWRCSDALVIDITLINPTAVYDGATAGIDIDAFNTPTQMSANWIQGSTFNLSHYEYCISTATNCAGTIVRTWTNVGLATTTTATGLSGLVNGTMYYVCVRGVNTSMGVSPATCSNGQTLDTTAPAAPAWANDGTGADIAWQRLTTQLSANWATVTDPSGISTYRYCLGTTAGGCETVGWTDVGATNVTRTGLALTNNVLYYACVRAVDGAGNVSVNRCTNGVRIDNVAPTIPASINDGTGADIDLQSLQTQLSANWPAGSDTQSGIARYELCFSTGTGCTGTIVMPWTSNAMALSRTETGLPLVNRSAYYSCVRLVDVAGNVSGSRCSDTVLAHWISIGSIDPGQVTQGETSVVLTIYGEGFDPGVAFSFLSGGFTTTSTTWISDSEAQVTVDVAPDAVPGLRTVTGLNPNGTGGGGVDVIEVLIDTSLLAPSQVDDGPTPTVDIDWFNTATSMSATWTPGPAGSSGLLRYEYCMSTGLGCAGTIVANWTSTGVATAVTQTGLTLVEDQVYYVCVRAVDTTLTVSQDVCSDGQTLDTIRPPAPTWVFDGPGADIEYTPLATELTANWDDATPVDTSGIVTFEYCIGTTTANCSIAAWTAEPTAGVTRASLSLSSGTRYYTCVRSVDGAGNRTLTPTCSNGQVVDTTPPTVPATVNDGTGADIALTQLQDTLSANWTASTDAHSGLATYEYCISDVTSCGGTPLVDWTPTTTTNFTETGLSPTNRTTYYTCVRAIDNMGNVSGMRCSNGVLVHWVSVSTVTPGTLAQGDSNVPVSIMGEGFLAGATVTISGTGVSIVSTTWISDSQIDIVVNVSVAATPGLRDVTVTNTNTTSGTAIGAVEVLVAPSAPQALAQYRANGTTAIASGAWTTDGVSTNVVLRFQVRHPQPSATLTPWVEVADFASGFANNCGEPGPGMYSGTNVSAPTANTWYNATVNVTGLTSGTQYVWRACAVDQLAVAGPWTARGSAPDFGVDTTSPSPPATVADGPGADIEWAPSTTQLSANWPAAVDVGSGINRYEYCISTSANCSTGIVVSWTGVGTATSLTRTGLALTVGTRYYTCVRTVDNVALMSASITCSNGQVPDNTLPPLPATVSDGTAADVTWTTSTTQLSANWPGVTDTGSGVDRYEYCFSTATNCTGTIVVGWTSNGTATTVTASPLTLVQGQVYFACVRVFDRAGNQSSGTRCSNGQTVDAAVASPASASDSLGADIQWQASTTSIAANWAAITDTPSGLNRYEVCFSTTTACGGTVVSTWSSTGTTASATRAVTLVNATTYYACIRAVDNAGNVSTLRCTNGVTVDTSPPSAPTPVNDGTAADLDWSNVTTQLSANWGTSTDSGSGLQRYEYCIATGTACSGSVVSTWTSTALVTSATRTGLTLVHGTLYYVAVRAVDQLGNVSGATTSDGIRIDTVPPPAVTTLAAPPSTTDPPALTWSTVVDALSGTAYYRVYRSTSSGVLGAQVNSNGATTVGSYDDLTVPLTGTYYYTVRAVDNAGNEQTVGNSQVQVAYVAPLYLRNTGSLHSSSWLLQTIPGSSADTGTKPKTSNVAVPPGFIPFQSGVSNNTVYSMSLSDTPSGNGWFYDAAPDTSYQAGTWRFWVSTQASRTHTSNVTVRAWKVTLNGSNIDTSSPIAGWTQGATNVGAVTSLQNHFVDVAMPQVAFAAGEYLYVEYWLEVTVPASGGGSNNTTVTFQTNTTGERIITTAPVPPNSPPNAPASLAQYRADGSTPIASGAWTIDGAATNVVLAFDVSDVDSGQALTPWVEVVPSASAFTGTCGVAGPGMYSGTAVNAVTGGTPYAASVNVTGLVSGTSYKWRACVVDQDPATSGWTVKGATPDFRVDATAPGVPASVADGTGADVAWTTSTTQLSANWPAATDAHSGLARYEYCMSSATSCGGTVVATWTSTTLTTSVTRTGLALVNGTTYFTCVRTVDAVGNASASMRCSNGQRVDATAPAAPTTVNDGAGADIAYQSSTTTIVANWTAVTDAISGLGRYDYCISTTTACGGTPLVGWTSNAAATSVTRGSLTLTPGTTYFVAVRAVDVAGNVGAVRTSNGVTIMSVGVPSPTSAPQGRKGLVVQVAGTGFVSGASVAFSGTGISVTGTTWVSSTRIDVTIDVAATATLGARNITVTNPDASNATRSSAFTITAPSMSIGLSSLGFSDGARDVTAPFVLSFGVLSEGETRDIGPAGSGQATPGAAMQVTTTADTDVDVQVSATTWSDGTNTMPVDRLRWRRFGTADPWTSMTAAPAVASTAAPGTTVHSFDLRLATPALQTAGTYSTTVTYTVVARP